MTRQLDMKIVWSRPLLCIPKFTGITISGTAIFSKQHSVPSVIFKGGDLGKMQERVTVI